MSQQKGFTLFETMFALVISSLVLGMAVSTGEDWIRKYRARVDSALLYEVLVRQRLHALQTHTPVTLCPSSDSRQCSAAWGPGGLLLFADRDADGILEAGESGLDFINLDTTSARLHWRSFRNKPYVQMDARGATNSLNGTLTYCPPPGHESLARRFVINRAGRVRVVADAQMNEEERSEVQVLCRRAYLG